MLKHPDNSAQVESVVGTAYFFGYSCYPHAGADVG
jgi:hypothetical protein